MIDSHIAITMLREVVAERPDFVYKTPYSDGLCRYVHGFGSEAEPGCLVGHVLYRLGVSLDDLRNVEEVPAYSLYMHDLVTPSAASVLDAAQCWQDAGRPWSEALAEAEARYAAC